MEAHYRFTDEAFEKQFKYCLLHPSYFTHEAHLRLAWIHLYKYGLQQAIKNVTHQLEEFTSSHGERTKYNTTVTVAAVRAVYHFMLDSESQTFKDFIEEVPRLKFDFKELLGYHYAFNIFDSDEAKEKYMEPDLLPFD
ncbi:MAG: hypothetical protein KJO05_06850 [Bacteroidia bacterium]|nr:hypothetical protein [Bacteroidia bacterium]NNF31993.1 hypothetical protein [Flavobacteriaceae bacterium]MBT8276169.1 hypothetical protein [Bacteroidia bacterium]NNJ81844.1 hypothetical protein [Flavobacteriaceae bacterium]NNK52944.1 hypothetical protein [Flavobacteriaceae bacterium]